MATTNTNRKKILAVVKLELDAGAANPAKVAKELGPRGVNVLEFGRAYNAATEAQRGTIVPAEVTVYEDRSFSFVTKTPPTSRLLLRAAGIDKGSARPNLDPVATVTRDQLRDIARVKLPDLNTTDLDQAEKMIAGTARSMGITVKD